MTPLLVGVAVGGVYLVRADDEGDSSTLPPATATWMSGQQDEKSAIETRIQENRESAPPPMSCPNCQKPKETSVAETPPAQAQTPAGDGAIIDNSYYPLAPKAFIGRNSWFEVEGSTMTAVFAGSLLNDATQGALVIFVGPAERVITGEQEGYNTPTKHGAVRIVDAVGEVLELEAEDGTTFYFDVASRSFVDGGTPVTTPEPVETMDAPQ